jgi:hypothetical protein
LQALPERAASTNDSQFEEDNRNVTEIGKVQALVLVQDIALWSGNRRKMEIAECRKFSLITPQVPG